jgi:sialidase-1
MKKITIAILFLISSIIPAQSKPGNVNITARTNVNPVFIENSKNIIRIIGVDIAPDKTNKVLNEVLFQTGNKFTANSLKSVKVFLVKGKSDSLLVETDKFAGLNTIIKFKHLLGTGSSSFKIAVEIKENTPLDSLLMFNCASVKINNKKYSLEGEFSGFRVGRIVRKPGDDNVKCYRIPGLVTTNNGTLLAVYDIRRKNSKDLPGDIDVGLSRSTDKGQTWQPMKVIMDMGEPHDQNGVGDPSILVDKQTGAIWVAALWSHGNKSWYGSKPGLTPDETGQLVLVKSTDDGLTWSQPESITPKTKNPKWNLFFQGPGNGISLSNGTLVFPAQFLDSLRMPHSTILYSTDHGLNWKTGTGAKPNTTESQVVELQNGNLMLNMRDNRGGSRSVAVTTDMGIRWIEHPTSRSALVEPVCMASFIRVFDRMPGTRYPLLAFSNPDSPVNRDSISIKFSLNDGDSWNQIRPILIDERECYGYSCLTVIDDKNLGLLYEGEGEIYFVKIKLPKEVLKVNINDFDGGSGIERIKKSK